eukprot:3355751-Rhodomonas_salina.4
MKRIPPNLPTTPMRNVLNIDKWRWQTRRGLHTQKASGHPSMAKLQPTRQQSIPNPLHNTTEQLSNSTFNWNERRTKNKGPRRAQQSTIVPISYANSYQKINR